MVQNIFIVGSKGIPASYGGYETFVDRLTEQHQGNGAISYHVACKQMKTEEFVHNGARCFGVKVPDIGPAQAVLYDILALRQSIKYIRKHNIENPIVYILACRIGPFSHYYYRKIKKLGGLLYINPDGHEWARAKWNRFIRRYWKFSESRMVHNCDLIICDSVAIQRYMELQYGDVPTTYISYGADRRESDIANDAPEWRNWLQKHELSPNGYYLIVGRFVPENNYEHMLNEFMESSSDKSLVLVTNVNDDFLTQLQDRTDFRNDKRVKFVGTVYNRELLLKIRENAFAYLHGHEVGGTNPSLLEAMSSTNLNLLLDVSFNREVALDSALYWSKKKGNLADLIESVDRYSDEIIRDHGKRCKQRINDSYTWEYIAEQYKSLFVKKGV